MRQISQTGHRWRSPQGSGIIRIGIHGASCGQNLREKSESEMIQDFLLGLLVDSEEMRSA